MNMTVNLKCYLLVKRVSLFFVDVPQIGYLTFIGRGHPDEEDFKKSCEALYTIAYIVKFEIARKQMDIDFKVNPMEVTWHLEKNNKEIAFTWEMMIMQPSFITKKEIEMAIEIAKKKGKDIAYDRIVYKQMTFGKCIQLFF